MASSPPASPTKSKSPCAFFPLGMCKKGDACLFSHATQRKDMGPAAGTTSKSPPKPNNSNGKAATSRKGEQSSDNVCRFWKTTGTCNRGESCFYTHEKPKRSSAPKQKKPGPSKLKSELKSEEPEEPEEVDDAEAVSVKSPTAPEPVPSDPEPEEEQVEQPTNEVPNEENGVQNASDNDWGESRNNWQDDKGSVASSPSIDPFSSNQSSAAYSQSSRNRPKSFSSIPPPQTNESSPSPLAPASSPSVQSLPAATYTTFAPLPPTTMFAPQAPPAPMPHWSEYADPTADLNKPFCKFFAQGRCSQGNACSARHSLAISEYMTLFREMAPPLWYPGMQSAPPQAISPIQSTVPTFQAPVPTFQAQAPVPTIQAPAPTFQAPVAAPPVAVAYPSQAPPQPTATTQSAAPPTARGLGACLFWPIGTCKNGDACPYAHIGPAGEPPEPTNNKNQQDFPSTQRDPSPQGRDGRQICRAYQQNGYCRNENWCNFSHDLSENHNNSDWSQPDRRSNRRDDGGGGRNDSDRDTSRPCRQYQAGYCRFGDQCRFAHDDAGAAQTSNNDDGWGTNANDQDDGGWNTWVNGWSTEPEPKEEPKNADAGWGDDALEEDTTNKAAKKGQDRQGTRDPPPSTNGDHSKKKKEKEKEKGKKKEKKAESVKDDGWGKNEVAEDADQDWGKNEMAEDADQGWGRNEVDADQGWGDDKLISETNDNQTKDKEGSVAEDDWGKGDSEHDSMNTPLCEDFANNGVCEKGDECEHRHEVLSRNQEDGMSALKGTHREDDEHREEEGQFEDVKITRNLQDRDTVDPEQQAWGSGAPDDTAASQEPVLTEDDDDLDDDSPPPIYEMPLIEKRMFNSVVQFGPSNGCLPTKIRSASESRRVMLYNLPPDVEYDQLRSALDKIAAVDFLDIAFSDDFATAAVDLLGSSQAQDITVQMDGRELFGRTIIARLDTTANETVMDPLARSSVLLSWLAPTRYAWVYFPTITIAKNEEARIRGAMVKGRKVGAEFFRPRPKQADSFAVKITGLPLDADVNSIKELCPKTSNVALGEPTYSAIPRDQIHELLRKTAALDSLSFLSLNDLTKTRHIAYARISDGMERVLQLHGVAQDFLGKGSISVFQTYHAAYRLPGKKFDAINSQLEELKKVAKAQEGCNVVAVPGEEEDEHVIHAHSNKSQDPAVFNRINQDLQQLIRGRVVSDGDQIIWDEYFDLPSSVKPLEKMNTDAPFFIQADHRLQQLRVWGDETGYKKASGDIKKLLKSVRIRKHIVDLDLSSIGKLVHGDYRALQRVLGVNKLSINVVSRQLVVRGDTEVLERVKQMIGPPGQALVSSGPMCVLCYRRPKPSVRLSCNHFYCRPCLRFVVQASNDPEFSPILCIGKVMDAAGTSMIQCPEAIPFVLARDLLPEGDLEQFLRYSFLSYIRRHADTYFFCPSTECDTLYKPGRKGALYQCPTCSTLVCSSCRLEYHEGVSCEGVSCEGDMAMEVDPTTP